MKPLFPALAGLGLAILATFALTAELGAVFGAGHSQTTRMQALEGGHPRVGLSTDSHKRVLDLCVDILVDPRIWEANAQSREAILSHCEAQTAQALAHAPSDGFTWWVTAVLAAERNDLGRVFTGLERSQQTAPGELWIALRRARLADQLEPLQTPAARHVQDADLLVLAQSTRGTNRLAARYLSDVAFRNRIISLIETLPPADQRRFVRNLRERQGS